MTYGKCWCHTEVPADNDDDKSAWSGQTIFCNVRNFVTPQDKTTYEEQPVMNNLESLASTVKGLDFGDSQEELEMRTSKKVLAIQ